MNIYFSEKYIAFLWYYVLYFPSLVVRSERLRLVFTSDGVVVGILVGVVRELPT